MIYQHKLFAEYRFFTKTLKIQNRTYCKTNRWTESAKKFVYMKRFGSSRVLRKSVTQRNKYLLRYKINRSLNFDINFPRKDSLRRLSRNSNLDNSSINMNKSSRYSHRAAMIMNALSRSDTSYGRNENIKKTLTYDSSSSSKENSSFDESTSIDSIFNTSLYTSDKSLGSNRNLSDTSTSSVPIISLESMDENQNQTPQQNQKVAKILSDTNTKKSAEKSSSSSSGSTSLLRSNMKEKIDSIICNVQTPELYFLKQSNRTPSYDLVASTPRNLLKEFNKDEEDSPHTPENIIQFIPESMSSIKKSHKKGRSYDPVWNKSLHAKRRTESLEADDILTSSSSYMATVNESPKKSRNAKKALIYNLDDEFSDNESISDCIKRKTITKTVNSSDCKIYEEDIQDIGDISTSSVSNCNDKENNFYLQKASLGNVDLIERENRSVSLEPDSAVSQDSRTDNGSVTSKKFVDVFDLTNERPNDTKCCEMRATAVGLVKMLDIQDQSTQDQEPQKSISNFLLSSKYLLNYNVICSKSYERPNTPENINSSRLLLPQFTSVKKSHKKDKRRNKSILNVSKYDVKGNECRKKAIGFLTDDGFTKKDSDKYRNESFPVSDEFKKKRFTNISLQNMSLHELLCSESLFSECEDTDDEFKIHTPIRKRMSSILDTVKNHVCRSKTSSEDDKPVEATNATDENGRLTPINMSTAELLCNIDSIKKSHKKDKHDGSMCKRRILEKKPSEYIKETENMNFMDNIKISRDHTSPSLKLNPNNDISCDEMGVCSNTHNVNNKKNEESIFDPQPSTSRGNNIIKKDMKKSKNLSTTPPNSWNAIKFMKLLHTTSIKKSHQKERKINSQSKYILMCHEYDLSDDGSIFDEDDRLTCMENFNPCQDKIE
ncbi:uncharacterized protein LOC105186708 isoform X2 [Harpegnathos saltator]|uniref:uncharacterized protein LOC105186708 isoform X2 n=1 Tax=Harpegnathos saltator TaxID=610380 RepID=UPI00058F5AD5|nr:uncharacterized protein LOC105186708 isoform X2 [Harpegnathos saltator]